MRRKIIIQRQFYEELQQVLEHFPKYHIKILLGNFNEKLGKGDICKRTIGNESLHHDSKDNGVRIVNFPTSKSLLVYKMMFLHRNIHKCTWTSPDGKTHNQTDHKLIDRRLHLSILDVRFFMGSYSDTDHYLVVAKDTERLEVCRQAAQNFDVERFNLRKLIELEMRKEYQIKISNNFAALENFSATEDINRAWKNIKRMSKPQLKRV